MSFSKTDHIFPNSPVQNIKQIIARILRKEYERSGSAHKKIGKKNDINPRTVKNWYEGRCAPNLKHFIALARTSTEMVECFLELTGRVELSTLLWLETHTMESDKYLEFEFFKVIFDTIKREGKFNVMKNLNQRQMWFYAEVRQFRKPTASDVASFWNVGCSTAKRDIAKVIKLNLVYFVGSRRNGHYALIKGP